MKSRKYVQKGKNSQHPAGSKAHKKSPSFQIHFDLSPRKMACFIEERKPRCQFMSKSTYVPSNSKQQTFSTGQFDENALNSWEGLNFRGKSHSAYQIEEEQIVQGSTNTILSQIERSGIAFKWRDSKEEISKEDEMQTSNIWVGPPNSDESYKSLASTSDGFSHHTHYSYYQAPPTYSMQWNTPDGHFTIIPQYILADSRTTVMIRNIPYFYSLQDMVAIVDYQFANCYDFLYLPKRGPEQYHAGYAFINFISTHYLLAFYQRFHGATWPLNSRHIQLCYITYSRVQGFNRLVEDLDCGKHKGIRKGSAIIRDYSAVAQVIKNQQTPN